MSGLIQYFQYVTSYIGIVLMGGAIVHLPAAPKRYAILAMIGAAVFLVSSYFEIKKKRSQDPNFGIWAYMLVSFFLSIGLGMISGSIQHFLDTPMYSSILLTAGFFISAFAFYIRENSNILSLHIVRYATLVVSITGILGGGLYSIAHSIEPHSHKTSSHKH